MSAPRGAGRRPRTDSDRAFDRYRRCLEQLTSIYRRARHEQWTFVQLLETKDRLRASLDWKRLRQGDRSTLNEIGGVLLSQLHERDLEWCLGPESGPIYRSGSDAWSPEISELCRQPGKLYGSHYWAGSDRLFGEWLPTNGALAAREPAPAAEIK